MPAWKRAWQGALGVEAALAFGAAAAFFALVGVTVAVVDSQLLVVALGVIYAVAIVAIFRFWGVGYAVPAAMAGLLAYDWFEFAPTHPLEFPDTAILGDLLVYLAVAVLIGQLAAYSGRRAALSEARVARLADEQAALRRVATLVARGVPPPEVFAAGAHEGGE